MNSPTRHEPDTLDWDDASQFAKFYDQVEPVITGTFGNFMGLAYWPDPDEDYDFVDGLVKLVHVLVEKIDLRPGQQLIDIGSGTGGPTLIYASQYGAMVTGIATSREHIKRAASNAAAAGLSDRARFQLADACRMPFADDTFDAALANGVMVHIADRAEAMSETFRVLRPGSRFAFCDIARRGILNEQQDQRLRRLVKKGLSTIDEYVDMARNSGFEVEEAIDCTENCRQVALKWLQRMDEYRASPSGQKHSPAIFEQLKSEVGKWVGLDKDVISYVIMVMRKPSG